MNNTKIEWVDKTWGPITGCTPIGMGCQNCYAERMANRFAGNYGYPKKNPFQIVLRPERLQEPLKMKSPTSIFVCSMSDLFHTDIPYDYLKEVFKVIGQAYWHRFLILTKRPGSMRLVMSKLSSEDFFQQNWCGAEDSDGFYYPNVWLGVSVSTQREAREKIPELMDIPCWGRFVSIEPLLEMVDITDYLSPGISYSPVWLDWVICGGETGAKARETKKEWVISLRDQCKDTGTPFFFKSWGEYYAGYRVGKATAGYKIDGKEHREYP